MDDFGKIEPKATVSEDNVESSNDVENVQEMEPEKPSENRKGINHKRGKEKIFLILGLCAGVLMICFGFLMNGIESELATADTSTSFGADFYTYSYQASAKTVMNLHELVLTVKHGFQYLLIGMGAADICYFGAKITKKEE